MCDAVNEKVASAETLLRFVERQMQVLETRLASRGGREGGSPQTEADSVFVCHVPRRASTADLARAMSTCGAVACVTMPPARHRPGHKGFAYVRFCHPDSATRALRMSGAISVGLGTVVTLPKRVNVPGLGAAQGKRRAAGAGLGKAPRERGACRAGRRSPYAQRTARE